ncbi:MAG: MBL fold metallo-hydrolase [Rhodobacteraceae bacterium]|nr:MBL fold metallo-hydrolase [Paracoccaceae bacterium]
MKYFTLSAVVALGLANTALAQEPVWDGNTVVLESQELADGVFAVIPTGADEMAAAGYPIATSGGFVIGENGVLVIESMLNQRLNTQLNELIAAETSLPVLYLVNTSYHGDHSYGNQYIADEIIIIKHVNAATYADEYLEEDKAFMIQNFGEGRGIEGVVPTDADILVGEGGSLRVDLGGVSVDIRDYGFAQTGGDLFVSVQSANVLWTGNPIVAQAPAVPWLLSGHLVETRDTLQAVYEAFDANTKVVPGHGPVTDIAAIKWGVDYLTAIEDGVSEAISDGLSLEETVASVQLPDFQGYALYGWVHPNMNVPAAYSDLK